MPVSPTLRRLLRIRDLQEEQHRQALDSALSELQLLENALRVVQQREVEGRRMAVSSLGSAEPADRLAARVELETAHRRAFALRPLVAAAGHHAEVRREQYLERRQDRRQAETLLDAARAEEDAAAARRGQRSLDDWYGAALYRRSLQPQERQAEPAMKNSQDFHNSEDPD